MKATAESTQVVPFDRPEAGLPAPATDLDNYTGYEDIDPSQFIIPRVKVVQPTSKEGTPGMFYLNLTGDEMKEIDITIVQAKQGRALWGKVTQRDYLTEEQRAIIEKLKNGRESDDEKPLCRSFDFLTPDSELPSPVCSQCVKVATEAGKKKLIPVCTMAGWMERKRPPCDETYNLLCLTVDDFLPFFMTLSGVSLSPIRKYISGIALRRGKLWQFQTTITLTEIKEPHRHYAIRFTPPRPIDPEVLDTIGESVIALRNVDFQQVVRAEEDRAEAAEGGGREPGCDDEDGCADNDTPPPEAEWMSQ